MNQIEKASNLAEKIIEAKNYERVSDGKRCFIAFSPVMDCFLTTTKMPLMGEWYDSDGIKHGG